MTAQPEHQNGKHQSQAMQSSSETQSCATSQPATHQPMAERQYERDTQSPTHDALSAIYNRDYRG